MIADFRSEDCVAAIDRILNVAQDMGEADLVDLPQSLLSCIAIRDPDIWLMAAQDLLGDAAGAAWRDLVQHGFVRDEHPLPLRDAVGPGRGLIRRDDPGRKQRIGDGAGGSGHALAHAPEDIGDGPLGDRQAKQLRGDPRQALEADMMAMMKVGQQRPNARAKGCSGLHSGRRYGAVASATSPAATTEQFHPCHNRLDGRQVDMVISVPANLGLA